MEEVSYSNRRVIAIAVVYIVYQEVFSHGNMLKTYDIMCALVKCV